MLSLGTLLSRWEARRADNKHDPLALDLTGFRQKRPRRVFGISPRVTYSFAS